MPLKKFDPNGMDAFFEVGKQTVPLELKSENGAPSHAVAIAT